MPDLFAAVRARVLESAPGLTDVYLGGPPPAPRLPYAVYTHVSDTEVQFLATEPAGWYEATFQVTVAARDEAHCRALAARAYDGFNPHRGKLVFDGGYDILRVPGGRSLNPTPPPNPDPGRRPPFFSAWFQVRVQVGLSLGRDP